MTPENIFGSVLWKGHYNGDLSLIHEQCKILLSSSKNLNTGLERDGGLSSSSDPNAPHMWDECLPFFDWLSPNLKTVWQDMRYPPGHVYPKGSWANIHPPGAWTDEHQHGSTALVVVLYVEQPDNGGNLEIFDPLFYNWGGTIRMPGMAWGEVSVKTGDVLMFPGWLLHRTQKN